MDRERKDRWAIKRSSHLYRWVVEAGHEEAVQNMCDVVRILVAQLWLFTVTATLVALLVGLLFTMLYFALDFFMWLVFIHMFELYAPFDFDDTLTWLFVLLISAAAIFVIRETTAASLKHPRVRPHIYNFTRRFCIHITFID